MSSDRSGLFGSAVEDRLKCRVIILFDAFLERSEIFDRGIGEFCLEIAIAFSGEMFDAFFLRFAGKELIDGEQVRDRRARLVEFDRCS